MALTVYDRTGKEIGSYEIDPTDLLGRDRYAERGRALDGRRVRELALERSRLQAEKAALRAEPRDCHHDRLALL